MPGQANRTIFDSRETWGLSATLKQTQDMLDAVFSNSNLAVNTRTVTTATTLVASDCVVISSANLTLPAAATWSTIDQKKSPFIMIKNTSAGAINITPNGAETIDGVGGATALGAGARVLLFTDGISAWYSK